MKITTEIKNEFKSNAKETIEYEEKYAFLIENNDININDLCMNGYVCPDNAYNVIGKWIYFLYNSCFIVLLVIIVNKRSKQIGCLFVQISRCCY